MPSPSPFASPNTPEALLPRSDSKNPARTCQGITANGRKCRRDLGAAAATSLAGGRRSSAPVLPAGSTSMFCWQHKNQAPGLDMPTLKEKTSDDTLAGRLGGLSIVDENERKRPRPAHMPKKTGRPGFWARLCCMVAPQDDGDRIEVVRHRDRVQARPQALTAPRPPYVKAHSADARLTKTPSATQGLMRFIPPDVPPQTASALLAELSKPVSPQDEPGYIYMFWLTDAARQQPGDAAASSVLLGPPPSQHQRQGERDAAGANELLRSFSTKKSAARPRILLKVGRANNVHRRMGEWQRQCGYNVSLVRFYPHDAAARGVRQVRCSHRVERLVHIELGQARAALGRCGTCAREHREWFEVDASREGVRAVDAVIRRWVGWAEGLAP